jgi:penicillin G amidase
MKRLRIALFTIVAITIVLLLGAIVYVRSSVPSYRADARIAGLRAEVEVWRDSMGVPHIWAASEDDLFRALGYVHAQDRLFQMELFRRTADGRLSEVLGADLVDADRFLRTIGLGAVAAENERLLTPEERALLQAYADGVNAWISGRRRALPPEFLALRFRPEPWTVRNTLSIARIMAWDLADWEEPLELQRAADLIGPDAAMLLRPPYPDWGDRILPRRTADTLKRAATLTGPRDRREIASHVAGVPVPRIPERARALIEGVSIAHASNSWVIGGEHTRSGRPILANDMHLALRAPPIWYLAALHGGEVEVVGMTLPGVPGVIAGHTPSVAWGFTNAQVADVDFFVEQVDPADSLSYLTPEGARPFVTRTDTIRVRGADDVIHSVRWTRNGPVISDVESRAGERVVAMRWAAHEPSSEVGAILRMNRARDADGFAEALDGFRSPHQNVVFADAAGVYGYGLVGRIPVRRSGDGGLPVPAWSGEHDWTGWIDPAEHPRARYRSGDPAAPGFIVTANNQQLAGASSADPGGFQIGRRWAEPYRAMRIRQLIEGGTAFTADDVAGQQRDVIDLHALRYRELAISAAAAAGLGEASDSLRAWDGAAVPDSRAAALFYVWYESLRRRIGEQRFQDRSMFFPRSALNRVLDGEADGWLAEDGAPADSLVRMHAVEAMRSAEREVRRRSWGDLHSTAIRHPLGTVAVLDRFLGLNLDPIVRGGSSYTVDVAPYGIRSPFTSGFGASQRHVVDLADPGGSGGFVVPGGQSGVPFSRHYADQARLWREGKLWRIPLDRERASERAVHRARMRPDGR